MVSKKNWFHAYHHVAYGKRTGSVTLADKTILKWIVKPGGLATIAFPDKSIIFLAKEKPKAR